MSAEQALALMESAIDVHDWNQKRQVIKYNINPEVKNDFLSLIDAQGIITKVSKSNRWYRRSQPQVISKR